ncbi:MAG TPA: hypothetical protein VGQ71_12040 [Terriglobales bacterium]|jgi:hypothetical protein|nr:hypothetical protein [Terriglobales bacterium]
MAKLYPRQEGTVTPTKLDWVRLAAYIDGEGSILITERHYKTSPYLGMYIRVVLANTDPRLCLWAQERFGGVFVISQRDKPAHHKTPYKWHVSCNQAACILERCLPYLLLKREQAEIALAFQSTVTNGRGRGAKLTDEERAIRESCKEDLLRLRQQRILPEHVVTPVM